MSSFVIARNYGQNTAPGRVSVKLDAAVNGELGFMIVTVAGYGRIPAAANAYAISYNVPLPGRSG